jgi:hypothetical protein
LGKQQYRWLVFIIAFILSAVYFFVFSKSGLIERMMLENEKSSIVTRTETLKLENIRLQRLLERYRNGIYPEGDAASSGYIRPDEKIILFRGLDDPIRANKQIKKSVSEFPIELPTMRIIWIILSSIVVILMVLYGRTMKEEQIP